jgi:LysR family transcriptional regulator, hydrogen peroxide-inducible genes activator
MAINRLDSLTVHDIRVCVVLADHLSFRKTAEAMDLTQPGVSAAVAKVERILGARLFFRTSRTCQLTAHGSDTLPAFRKALATLEAADLGSPELLAGNLRIGIIPTIAPFIMAALHDDLRHRHPASAPHVVEAHTETLLHDLITSQIDLAIVSSFATIRGIESVLLTHEPLLLAVPDHHPLAAFERVDPSQLDVKEILSLERGNCLREQTLRLCDLGPETESRFHTTSLMSLLQLVIAKQGIAVIPAMCGPYARQLKGVELRPFDTPTTREIVLARRTDDPRAAALDRFAADSIQRLAIPWREELQMAGPTCAFSDLSKIRCP